MNLDIPINRLTLLKLYYYDRIFTKGMPEFDELSDKRIDYLLDSYCYDLFCKSNRAKELQLEMLATLN